MPRERRNARRRDAPSCGTTTGSSGIVSGGYANSADAAESGVFVGQGNAVCDDQTAVVAGVDNLIDSGNGASGGGAAQSIIGAGQANEIQSGATQTMIGAGVANLATAPEAFIGSGMSNSVTGAYSIVGAGVNDAARGPYAFVGAGNNNQVNGTVAGIAAGDGNVVTGNGSFVGAGGSLYGAQTGNNASDPSDMVSGADSFIGAGDENAVASNESFIGSGLLNTIGSSATYASILGGSRNAASAQYASVLGGFGNSASGPYAIVAGGDADLAAGTLSFAAGYHAHAGHDGSFVWSDFHSGSAAVTDKAADQFVVRASGGTYVYSNEAATAGVRLAAGSGSWASLSDRNAKTHVAGLDDAAILAKLVTLPVSAWSYTSESGVRHIGPMAQDFYAAFGVGEDDRHITAIDEDGVAFAAIQALHAESARLREENVRLRQANVRVESLLTMLASQNAGMEARLEALEARSRR